LSRYATSFVLAYHGCDKALGIEAVERKTELLASQSEFDWLGPGAYFWESDPIRAMEWAQSKKKRWQCETPFVIGAAIDLGNCLDLMVRENIALLVPAYETLKAEAEATGGKLPINKDVKGAPGSKTLRKLDCAVISQLHQLIDEQPEEGLPGIGRLESYDTVRGLFPEGPEVFPGSGFQTQTHAQIAVRNMKCIKGLFYFTAP